MNSRTEKRLSDAGWNKDRNIDIKEINMVYAKIGLKIPFNVEIFLRQFGMLKIDPIDKTYFDVEFNPIKAIGINLDAAYFETCLEEYGITDMVYPVGVARRENLLVLMSEDDVFYCFTDGCLAKVGNNVYEMLDCLVGECREAEMIE